MRQQLMDDTAEFLRARGHKVSWLIDNAILAPGITNPDAEIVLTVDGKEFRENALPNADVYSLTSYIENALLP